MWQEKWSPHAAVPLSLFWFLANLIVVVNYQVVETRTQPTIFSQHRPQVQGKKKKIRNEFYGHAEDLFWEIYQDPLLKA